VLGRLLQYFLKNIYKLCTSRCRNSSVICRMDRKQWTVYWLKAPDHRTGITVPRVYDDASYQQSAGSVRSFVSVWDVIGWAGNHTYRRQRLKWRFGKMATFFRPRSVLPRHHIAAGLCCSFSAWTTDWGSGNICCCDDEAVPRCKFHEELKVLLTCRLPTTNARWSYWRCFLFRVKEVGYDDRAPNVIRQNQHSSIAPASWRTPLCDE
jgi:hypothetical protein